MAFSSGDGAGADDVEFAPVNTKRTDAMSLQLRLWQAPRGR
jgi:hypothetical protein